MPLYSPRPWANWGRSILIKPFAGQMILMCTGVGTSSPDLGGKADRRPRCEDMTCSKFALPTLVGSSAPLLGDAAGESARGYRGTKIRRPRNAALLVAPSRYHYGHSPFSPFHLNMYTANSDVLQMEES